MSKHSGFLELLKAPLRIISQNGKLMSITATIYLILSAISLLLFTLSTNPFILDLTIKLINLASARAGTPEFNQLLVDIRKDIGIFFGIEGAYMVLFFFISLFAHTAIVITASTYYSGYDLSVKELTLKVSKTWTRPFITSIWIYLLSLGYTTFFLFPFLVPSLLLLDHPILLVIVLIFLIILFFTLYIYLSVIWTLAVVVSIVEDSYGFSALGKAKELLKGKMVHGILLNLLFVFVLVVIIPIVSKLSLLMPIVAGVIQAVLIGVVTMFQWIAYSGFYFQCKDGMIKSGGSEYSQLPSSHVVDEGLP